MSENFVLKEFNGTTLTLYCDDYGVPNFSISHEGIDFDLWDDGNLSDSVKEFERISKHRYEQDEFGLVQIIDD